MKYKFLVAAAVVWVISWLFWFNLKSFIQGQDLNGFNLELVGNYSFLILVLFFGLNLSVLSLSFLLFSKQKAVPLFVGIILLAFSMVFGYGKLYLPAFILVFLFQYAAIGRFKIELDSHLKVRIWHIMRRAGPAVVTSFFVLISFSYFLSPSAQSVAVKNELPESLQKIVEFVVESYTADQPDISQGLINSAKKEVVSQLNSLFSPYYKFVPPLLAFGLFLILQGFSFLFVWFSAIISVLLFWIIKKSGLVRIETIKKEAEVLKF